MCAERGPQGDRPLRAFCAFGAALVGEAPRSMPRAIDLAG